jgi:hypothetical protein
MWSDKMALKGLWVDKVDGVDINSADDINEVAHAVIELEENTGKIESALDGIIAIQYTLIGGENE